jgi:hypothetical protein
MNQTVLLLSSTLNDGQGQYLPKDHSRKEVQTVAIESTLFDHSPRFSNNNSRSLTLSLSLLFLLSTLHLNPHSPPLN